MSGHTDMVLVDENGMRIDGDDENAEVAADAIRYIEENSQKGNLTEKVKALIEERLPGAGEE